MRRLAKLNFFDTSGNKIIEINGIPLLITYQPLLKGFAKVLNKHLHPLYMNEEVKKTLTPGPMVSFWGAQKLSDYLVRTELYPLERSAGSFKCNGKRC